ncbi:MAG: glycosyltransferase family 8 protein [Pirellulaceae bacterium]
MTIHLLSTCNANYTVPFRVTVHSLLEHLPEDCEVHWYVFWPDLVDGVESSFARLVAGRSVRFHWLTVSPEKLEGLPVRGHFVPHVYTRILAPACLPESVDRFLYLDADLLVLDDITPLWKTPLGDNVIAAVPDLAVPKVSSPMGLRLFRELGIAPDAPYFNAGVYLADTHAWERRHIAQRAIEYLDRHAQEINLLDQDALNAVLCGQWKALDVRWNLVASLCGRSHYQPLGIDENELRRAQNRPGIVHYAGLLKPWAHPGIASFKVSRYLEVLEQACPKHRLQDSLKARSLGFYDRRLRGLFYPLEQFIWNKRKGF